MLVQPSLLLALICSTAAVPESPGDTAVINPLPRVALSELVQEWDFKQDSEGWVQQNNCTVSVTNGLLQVRATGFDPYFRCPVDVDGGIMVMKIKARCRTSGPGTVYWATDLSPREGEDKVAAFFPKHDGEWREYTVQMRAPGRLTNLRIDPGQDAGQFDIDTIRLIRKELHPLTIDDIQIDGKEVRFLIRNHGTAATSFSADEKDHTIEPDGTIQIARPRRGSMPLEAISLTLKPKSKFPPTRRTVFIHNRTAKADWIDRPLGSFTLHVTQDGSMARIDRDGRLVAFLGPIVHCDGLIPALKLVDDGSILRFRGQGIALSLDASESDLKILIESDREIEGPVVRVVGEMRQGQFAGIEYLGRNERSSSTLDCETAERIRFAPDPLKVTMPLMAILTDRASVALMWEDMMLQPVFACPNFFDGTPDRRMALRGKKIDATVRFSDATMEQVIVQAVKRAGLPPLPKPPRTAAEQKQLCLDALNGPLRTKDGWGHCVQERWKRQPFVDVASTYWRLSGEIPELPRLVPGGAHVANESIYFVTGRAQEWLDLHAARVRGSMARQRPDGSFRYAGPYRRGHFEDTSSGVCARPAAMLLEHARMTGDRESLAAGIRALEFMKRFNTPRGAQVWEVPLHTPDQLASAYLVWAYVRGFELTGEKQYLAEARKWAASGIPFTYLWSEHPIMLYATPPVLGATHWKAPMWIGLPVQWVGGVYAYALTMLAPYDDTLDWNHLARGILISAEQQQYPEGLHQGLLPDSFGLAAQQRRPADINPCAIWSLRMVLDGELDSLCVAISEKHRVVAPFSASIADGKARIEAKAGMTYQIVVDGSKIITVKSRGDDEVPLP